VRFVVRKFDNTEEFLVAFEIQFRSFVKKTSESMLQCEKLNMTTTMLSAEFKNKSDQKNEEKTKQIFEL
jgi:hypothetical protein